MAKSNVVNLEEIISKVTKEAIKEYNREQKEDQKKVVFHNTKLLLSHYNDLKNHVDNAIDDFNKLKESELRGSDYINMDRVQDELYILSIKKSKIKTLIMIAHIDMLMGVLKKKQEKSGNAYKYEILKNFYIDEMTYEEVQEKFNCGKNTPGRWMNEMITELSILLFGVDGLKMDVV